MSLTDMVIMPGADYLDACNAVREKTGGTAAIKSGELGSKIRSISGSSEADHSAEDGLVTRTITSYTNSRVTSIGLYAFRDMTSLLSVDFPNVTNIGTYAFWYSSNLQSCSFPNAREIGTGAFQNCRALTTLDFPVATSIGNQTFSGCSTLVTLVLRNASAVCTLAGTNSFANTPIASGTGYIYVPRALVDSYKAATNWSTYANQIRAIEDYPEICGT